MMNDVLFP